MTSEPRHFRLYHTTGCHLCELATDVLVPFVARHRWQVELIDIAGDDELEERYGVRIPVLQEAASGAELGWPFDAEVVLATFGH